MALLKLYGRNCFYNFWNLPNLPKPTSKWLEGRGNCLINFLLGVSFWVGRVIKGAGKMIYSVKWSSEKPLTATFIVYYSIQWEILTCQLTWIQCKGSGKCSSEFHIGLNFIIWLFHNVKYGISKYGLGFRICQDSL